MVWKQHQGARRFTHLKGPQESWVLVRIRRWQECSVETEKIDLAEDSS